MTNRAALESEITRIDERLNAIAPEVSRLVAERDQLYENRIAVMTEINNCLRAEIQEQQGRKGK